MVLALALGGAPALAQVPTELDRRLPELAYPIDLGPERTFQLRGGRYSSPAERIDISLVSRAYGDVDGDAWTDGVVILVLDGGGSGRFVYLAVVLNRNNRPQPLSAVLIGDRVPVRELRVDRGGTIVAVVCERAEQAPMASRDCQTAERRYALRDGRIISLQAEAAARSACLEASRRIGLAEPRVEAQRFVGGPIWQLRLEDGSGVVHCCTYNVVSRQAEVE